MESAQAWRVRPTALIEGKKESGKWTEMDRLVVRAIFLAESERCGVCRYPMWMCRNEDGDLDIATEEHTCFVERARQMREDKERGKDGKNDLSGKSYAAEPYSKTGRPLSSFREPYWESYSKRRKDITDSRIASRPEPS